jgi:hypothetical protein
MSSMSVLSRAMASLAIAMSIGAGFSAPAEAAPYRTTCAGGICFHKDTQGYTNNKTYFYLTFNGDAVTHYNVRYHEPGGRVVQGELKTYKGSNKSQEGAIKGKPGTKVYVSIQACRRYQVKVGPFSVKTQSSCTNWVQIGYYAV